MKEKNCSPGNIILVFIILYNVMLCTTAFSNGFDPDKDAIELSRTLTGKDTKPKTCLNIIKPEDLGLEVSHGQIDYKKMTKQQADTIVIAMFNPEDNYLDIAVFYKSRNEIVIYLNQANGYLAEYTHIPYKSENVDRIEAFIDKKNSDYAPQSVKCSLKVIYKDKTQRIITNGMINGENMLESGCDNTFFRMFDFPRNSILSLNFVQVWSHSENTHNALSYYSAVDDIDNDGKTEIVYSYILNNTPPYPAKVIVFKSLGNSQFVVEWDSVFTNGADMENNQTADFDNNGMKESFLVAYFPLLNRVCSGLLEKNEYGYYHFYYDQINSYLGPTVAIEYRDTMEIGAYKNKGFWECISVNNPQEPDETSIIRAVFTGYKNDLVYSFYSDPYIIKEEDRYTYDMKVFDMDGDGKEEILLGDVQFGTSYFGYLDSTGVGTNHGYEYKYVIPNERVAAGYIYQKDYDNDELKEFYLAGPGDGMGSIAVVKHTGGPGTNNFQVMWWDTTGIVGAPINGMDSGYVDGIYSFVHPAVRHIGGAYPRRHLYVFTRDGLYNFKRSYYQATDSVVNIQPHLTDVEHTGKAYIIAPQSEGYYGHLENYISVFKQLGSIGINPINTQVPEGYVLMQNYPNPFNPVTKIAFGLPKEGKVKLVIYDIMGREIKTLINNEFRSAGKYITEFNGSNFASGVYFYRIQSGGFIQTKRMVLIK